VIGFRSNPHCSEGKDVDSRLGELEIASPSKAGLANFNPQEGHIICYGLT
jgi:hypothetical protein